MAIYVPLIISMLYNLILKSPYCDIYENTLQTSCFRFTILISFPEGPNSTRNIKLVAVKFNMKSLKYTSAAVSTLYLATCLISYDTLG